MASRKEFQILSGLSPEDLTRQLGEMSVDGWEVSTFAATGAASYTVLVERAVKKNRRGDADN